MNILKTVNKSSLSILSIAILIFLGWGIYKLIDILIHPPLYVVIQFEDLGPIYKRMPVYYKGYKIGKTKKIEPSKDYKTTLVTIDFYPKELKLPDNTTAKVKKLDTGIDYIELLYPQSPSEKFMATGEVIKGETTMDIQSFMSAQAESGNLNGIFENASQTLDSITKTSDEAKKVLTSLNSSINENRKNIKQITYNLSQTTKSLDEITSNLNASLPKQRLDNTTSNIEETTNNIKVLTKNLNKTVEITNSTMCELNSTSKYINKLSKDVQKSVEKRQGFMGFILGK